MPLFHPELLQLTKEVSYICTSIGSVVCCVNYKNGSHVQGSNIQNEMNEHGYDINWNSSGHKASRILSLVRIDSKFARNLIKIPQKSSCFLSM